MLLCESLLMALISLLGIYVTYTDIKNGIIQNKALLSACLLGGGTNAVYLGVFVKDLFVLYIVNLLIISSFAIALYFFHFWAAGDSKLLICVTMLFPARLYDKEIISFAPGMVVFIYIFLIAYIYIIIDTIACLLKKEKYYSVKLFGKGQIWVFLKNYVICFIYLRALGEVLRAVLGEIYFQNQIVFCFVNIFIAMYIHSKPIFRKWYFLLIAIVTNVVFIGSFSFSVNNLYGYAVLLLALLLRRILNGYNYKQIPTEEVQKGMVLSVATIFMFEPSRIKGLPHSTFEDMRSRLSEEEANAVKRWKDSSQGKEMVTIVRKMPFAIFIILGELMYFAFRVFA